MLKVHDTHVTIMVRDFDGAIKFYESIGLTLRDRWGDGYATVATNGITIGIHPAGEEYSGSGNVSIGFIIDSIGDAKKILEANNISYAINEDEAGIFATFRDPDGTNLYFMQPAFGAPDNA